MLFNPLKLSIVFIISTILLSGCLSLKEKADIKAAQEAAERHLRIAEEIKSYGPPTVIYRIDDHRFFTLENYNQKREGITYYNNTQRNIHQKMIHGSACLYQGRLIWATDREDAFVFPVVLNRRTDRCAGTQYGCVNAIIVTIDGGKNFLPINGGFGQNTDYPGPKSAYFDIIVTHDGFYLGKTTVRRRENNDELAKPWWRLISFNPTKPNYVHDSWGEEKDPPTNLKTPSGQTRFDCSDPAIFPISKAEK